MLQKVTNAAELSEIVNYIGNNYKQVPYLYVNTVKFGLGTENVFTWIDRNDGQICGVYMLYYECIHFFTNDIESYPIDRILDFLSKTKHKVIILQGEFGKRLDGYLAENYSFTCNYIVDLDQTRTLSADGIEGETASREDISSIVDLMMLDPEFNNVYNRKILESQLYDRFDSNFSRFFIVKKDGKIVAATSTKGEVPGFAIIGGLIIHPDYRGMGLGKYIESFPCNLLEKEKKSRVAFVGFHNKSSMALHEKIGGINIGSVSKYVMKD